MDTLCVSHSVPLFGTPVLGRPRRVLASLSLAVLYAFGMTGPAMSAEASGRVAHRAALEQRAEQGDYEALALLVQPLLVKGVDLSTVRHGVKWLSRAAEVGIAGAQFHLGARLLLGDGLEQDEVAAIVWLKQAAQQEYVEAYPLLGFCYLWGKGGPCDYSSAVEWLQKGTDHNLPWAMLGLAQCREHGWGIQRDEAEAFKLYRRAAKEGLVAAQKELGRCFATSMGVETNPQEAFAWTLKAAQAGDLPSRLLVADFYAQGFGVARDDREAFRWASTAAAEGHAAAQFLAARFLLAGDEADRDYVAASRWSKRAAQQGHANAQQAMAAMYFHGTGVPQNFALAYAWASVAAAQGVADAAKLRDYVATRMTPAQVLAAQRMAAAFKPRLEGDTEPDAEAPAAANSGSYASGSGFFVTTEGLFVTNHHVIVDARRIVVKTAAGVFPATVARVDAANDIAVLKVSGTFTALPVRGSRLLKLADRVATVGFPNPDIQGVAAKYSSGEVAALTGAGDDPRYIQISVPLQTGNSGGPLVDETGSVVGVVAAQLDKERTADQTGDTPENVNYAVKGSLLLNLLESLGDATATLPPAGAVPLPSARAVAAATEAAIGMVLVER
jgi:TPR repeat protein